MTKLRSNEMKCLEDSPNPEGVKLSWSGGRAR